MSELLPQLENLTTQQQELLRLRLQQVRQRAEQPASFHELFQAQVRRCPDRVAVVAGEVQVSFGELDRWSNRLAWLLRGRGVGRESLVGLCVPRSVEMVVGVLAVLKAGGAYVPLDPGYPRERLAYMVEDAGVRVVLAGRSVAGVLPDAGASVLVVEDVWAELERWPDTAPEVDGTCDNLAYVIYTSGSTGRPKGVAVTQPASATRAGRLPYFDLDTPSGCCRALPQASTSPSANSASPCCPAARW